MTRQYNKVYVKTFSGGGSIYVCASEFSQTWIKLCKQESDSIPFLLKDNMQDAMASRKPFMVSFKWLDYPQLKRAL